MIMQFWNLITRMISCFSWRLSAVVCIYNCFLFKIELQRQYNFIYRRRKWSIRQLMQKRMACHRKRKKVGPLWSATSMKTKSKLPNGQFDWLPFCLPSLTFFQSLGKSVFYYLNYERNFVLKTCNIGTFFYICLPFNYE